MTRRPSVHLREDWLWIAALAVLCVLRLPAVVAPAGSDQSLYMYVADRILAGGAPYVDAWDQKPPGVHLAYAMVRAVWPHTSAVAILDVVATAWTACFLVAIGRRLASPRAGFVAAAVFMLFGDPAIARLDGLYLRGQCEVLIGLAATAALWTTWERERRTATLVLAGACLGAAFWLKYNALTYAVPALMAAALTTRRRAPVVPDVPVVPVFLGAVAISVPVLVFLFTHDALTDWRIATIDYNLAYSGETYTGGWWGGLAYALMLPLHRMRMDLLWFLGGLGVLLTATAPRVSSRTTAVLAAWLAAALGSILLNGARDLPQYFIQAKPPLALALGLGVASLAGRSRVTTILAAVVVTAGLWKVGTDAPGPLGLRWGGLPQAIENVSLDISYAAGSLERRAYLARFKGQQKYDALESDSLAELIRTTTDPSETVFVFGFAPSVYLDSGRVSASRFFWSRPVVIEFAAHRSDYGSRGLLADLASRRPAVIALQKQDWGPAEPVSHDFMLNTPRLRAWLEAGYVLERDTAFFSIWRRRS